MEKIVQILKAAGDKNRFRILMMLMERPLCVCEILEVLEIKGGTLTAHLKLLKNAGLITQKKKGRWVIYSLAKGKVEKYLKQVEKEIFDKTLITEDTVKVNLICERDCSSVTGNLNS